MSRVDMQYTKRNGECGFRGSSLYIQFLGRNDVIKPMF